MWIPDRRGLFTHRGRRTRGTPGQTIGGSQARLRPRCRHSPLHIIPRTRPHLPNSLRSRGLVEWRTGVVKKTVNAKSKYFIVQEGEESQTEPDSKLQGRRGLRLQHAEDRQCQWRRIKVTRRPTKAIWMTIVTRNIKRSTRTTSSWHEHSDYTNWDELYQHSVVD